MTYHCAKSMLSEHITHKVMLYYNLNYIQRRLILKLNADMHSNDNYKFICELWLVVAAE